MAPTIGDVVDDPLVALGGGGGGGGRPKAKPKPKLAPKPKVKAVPTTPGQEGNDPPPVEVTTPLQKAKALAKSVFLDYFDQLFIWSSSLCGCSNCVLPPESSSQLHLFSK